ncbi:hypothetical protein MsAg5_05280 [Methanosarcinaceae archaeon Ag5]|uniref:GLUG domain-containing protein n=1 Tax=Methanolapillus africanus TaxID=3028297 RepID=A0AAE4SDK4_9EURY|nr:hypothetical protein [Methanosarcinaceae archaeon Ag5]
MDSKEETKYKQKKYIPVAIIILLLLLAVFTYYYVQNNAEVNAMLDCKCANPSPIATGYEPTEPVKSSSPDAIHVTPGGNGTNPPTPGIPTIASVELYDYNQDNAKSLRVVLKMDNPSMQITDLSVEYENANDPADNGSIAIDTTSPSQFTAMGVNTGKYLVSIPAVSGNPLDEVGTVHYNDTSDKVGYLKTYEYHFEINTDAGISKSSYYPFQSGTGVVSSPFEIQNIVQFDALRYHTGNDSGGRYYAVTKDIDFPSEWNNNSAGDRALSDGTGWVPIGGNKTAAPSPYTPFYDTDAFRGNVDFKNKTFSNFIIQTEKPAAGLFGSIGGIYKRNNTTDVWEFYRKAEIKDLKITSMTIKNAGTTKPVSVGSLTGYANNSTIKNINVTMEVEGKSVAGGLAGYIVNSTVDDSRVTGTVATYEISAGGLIGSAYDCSINNSHSVTDVTGGKSGGTNTNQTAGLISNMAGTNIKDSTSTGTISGYGHTGGLVGIIYYGYPFSSTGSKIINSSHTGDISGRNMTGGLVGIANGGENLLIEDSTVTGDITISFLRSQDEGVGGLVGLFNTYNSTIKNSSYVGNISCVGTTTKQKDIGGLVGFGFSSNVTVIDSKAETNITVNYAENVGGIAGETHTTWTIENTTAIGNITAVNIGPNTANMINAGGLVGDFRNNSTIINSSSMMNINGANDTSLSGRSYGGLVGSSTNDSKIINSYAAGNVTSNGMRVGGLVGSTLGIVIEDSYSTGTVKGRGEVGGLIGNVTRNEDRNQLNPLIIEKIHPAYISNSYATGDVITTDTDNGGLFGRIGSNVTIENCIALNTNISGYDRIGRVYGSIATGAENNSISNNYAYENMTVAVSRFSTSGTVSENTGTNGLNVTAAQAKSLTFYTDPATLNWNDGTTVWEIRSGYPLPVLTWQTTVPANPPAWATA